MQEIFMLEDLLKIIRKLFITFRLKWSLTILINKQMMAHTFRSILQETERLSHI